MANNRELSQFGSFVEVSNSTVGISTDVFVTGIVSATNGFVGSITGNADTATSLANARTFEITGDVVGSAVSFDGTGNVSIAATIQPNSVALGTDTFGNYVATIAGTAGEVEVSGSGSESAAVTISLPDIISISGVNASGVITATTFNGSLATSNLDGTITNAQLDGSITNDKLVNSSVNFGGVTVSLGGTDASPAFNLADATGLPVSTGISGLGANVATFLATPSSANLASAVTGETGSGALVFATSPTLITPTLGLASATSINASGIVTATGGFNIGIQSAGINVTTGVITALNFVGAGNTFQYNAGTKTIDISIQGGGVLEVETTVSTTNATGVGSFAVATYRFADVIAQISQGSSYQVGRYLMIHDGTTVTVVEESSISTGDMLGSFDGIINGANAELRVTLVSAGIAATVTTKIDTISIP